MSQNLTDYYNRTAQNYDQLHLGDNDTEHIRSLEKSWPLLERLDITSVVDVGCGTGRALAWFDQQRPSLNLVGIDPSEGLQEIARDRLPHVRFEVGSGERLPLENNSVDLVVATGIMHHVDSPKDVIQEMFRVAKKAVLISDHNNFAFRGSKARRLRLWLYASGLLDFVTFVHQGFRKQGYSDDDGWWYAYSLLNDFGLIASLSAEQYIIPTRPSNSDRGNLLLSQSHLAILAMKL